jgi:UDP-glucose:(heptosyl)LPS alpha-1,3-glucosyltransferase
MRIGLVIDRFRPLRGGAEQWTYQFTRHLLAEGHEVHVVAQDFVPEAEQLPIVQHPVGRIRSASRLAEAVERQLRTLSLDVIHDMGTGWYGDIFESHYGSRYGQWDRKLSLLPRWLRPWKRASIRLLPRYRRLHHLMQRQFSDPHQIVIALSKMVARDYEHYHAVPRERIRLVYNGVDTERFSPARCDQHRHEVRQRLGIADAEVAFLFNGHDYARKGLSVAMRAVGILARDHRPVRLLVLGGKPNWRWLRLAHGLRLDGRAVFVGVADDPVPFYAAADAVVLPTFYDPCALVTLEAAACGLPNVTTQFNGSAELLTNGVDGFVQDDPADYRELASRLEQLLDPTLRRRMGEAARRTALQHTFDRNFREVLAVYRQVLGIHRRAA